MIPRFSHDLHEREALHDSPGKRRINTADQHGGLRAELYLAQRMAQRVCRRRATCGDHVAHPTQAKAHADFAGERAGSAAGDGEQAYLLDLACVVEIVLMLGEVLRAAARAKNHANLALLVEGEL